MLIKTMALIIFVISLLVGVYPPSPTALSSNIFPSAFSTTPENFKIELFPVAPYHVGDVLSIRVTFLGTEEISTMEISVSLMDDPGTELGTASFSRSSKQAVFYWILDTTVNNPGFLQFVFTVPEMGLTWTDGIHLLPTPDNRTSEWAVVHSACCTIHTLTGSDAENDIEKIMQILDERTEIAFSQFLPGQSSDRNTITDPFSIVLIPIVVGHGGFATHEAVMTYSERNWAGIEFEILAHHEIVHVIDRQINTEGPRPSLFVEGIAVYLSGGHYKEGDALQRAAALLELGMYIPITEIVNDFYAAQHEIGYMEAAALVAYLVEVWGWETFRDFYFNLPEGETDAAIISSALERQFSMNLGELESNFVAYLQNLTPDDQVKADVRLTVEVYDMIRRYQTIAFPSAHFRTAWWPPIDTMRQMGIVGDYAFREKSPFNIIVEGLFLSIHTEMKAGNYEKVEEYLSVINHYLTLPTSHYAIGWPLLKFSINTSSIK